MKKEEILKTINDGVIKVKEVGGSNADIVEVLNHAKKIWKETLDEFKLNTKRFPRAGWEIEVHNVESLLKDIDSLIDIYK